MEESRGQFTFYRSYWEALRELPKKDRLPILDALIAYALDGTEPTALTKVQSAVFALIRPTLDTGRKKAKSGKLGGSNGKQTASKPQANGKQTPREKEREKEKEKEVEIEGEKDKRSAPPASDGKAFTQFWEAYPNKAAREDAWEAWKSLNPAPDLIDKIMCSLDGWKQSGQWLEDSGRFVPHAAKWLNKGYYENCPTPKDPQNKPRQLDADEQAAIMRMLEGGIPNE
jgi:hypothetical protein